MGLFVRHVTSGGIRLVKAKKCKGTKCPSSHRQQVKKKRVFWSFSRPTRKPSFHDNNNRTDPAAANPVNDDSEYGGKKTGFIRRQRQVTGAGFAQALVLGGLAHPEATRKQQQQAATQAGLRVSVQGFEQRFSASAVCFMRTLLATGLTQVVRGEAGAPLLPRFTGVYLTDCSRFVWGATGVKLALRWELQHGQLQAELLEVQQHDQQAALVSGPLPVGALVLNDLGFFNLRQFQRWNTAGVYWLSRFKLGTTLTTPAGQPIPLLQHLAQAHQPFQLAVRLGKGQPVAAYLLAAPLPDAAYAQRCARLHEQARLDQRPLSPQQLACARWALYVTNCPDLSGAQAHVLARTRWQIELLFKLWKSQGKVLVSRSADPLRRQVEGYAKLLGVIVAHWLLLVSGWQLQAVSLVDAFACVRTHATLLLYAFRFPLLWPCIAEALRAALAAAPRRSPRRSRPSAFQLWRDFETLPP